MYYFFCLVCGEDDYFKVDCSKRKFIVSNMEVLKGCGIFWKIWDVIESRVIR